MEHFLSSHGILLPCCPLSCSLALLSLAMRHFEGFPFLQFGCSGDKNDLGCTVHLIYLDHHAQFCSLHSSVNLERMEEGRNKPACHPISPSLYHLINALVINIALYMLTEHFRNILRTEVLLQGYNILLHITILLQKI